MSILLGLTILDSGVPLSMVCAVIGLAFALCLIAIVSRSSAGNEKMRQISAAVQEGAKAYLNRQVITISVIAVDHFRSAFHFQGSSHGGWFCSRRVLLPRGRFHRNAHRSAGECAYDAGGDQLAHRCVARRVQRRRGNRFARGRSCAPFGRDLLYASPAKWSDMTWRFAAWSDSRWARV